MVPITRRVAVGVFTALLCTLSACEKKGSSASTDGKGGSPAGGKHEIHVGFSQIGAESDWRKAATESIRSEADARGINLEILDAQQKQENQIKALRTFIVKKVDVIALAPVVSTGWEPVLKEVKAAGIPVILTDRVVDVEDPTLYTTFIGADFVEEGRRAAEWLVKETNGKANIVELQGTPGAAPAKDRKAGFDEVIARHPEMKILKSQSGNFNRKEGREVMESFLKSPEGKDITAVYAHNDDMALGAVLAIEEAGLKPGVDIKVVSIDGVRSAFEAMVQGKLNCTVECTPLLGPKLFDTIEAVMAKKPVERRIVTDAVVFTKDTAAEDIKTRKY